MGKQIVVTVKPGSRKGPLVETNPAGSMTVYVREPAAEGQQRPRQLPAGKLHADTHPGTAAIQLAGRRELWPPRQQRHAAVVAAAPADKGRQQQL